MVYYAYMTRIAVSYANPQLYVVQYLDAYPTIVEIQAVSTV